MAVALQFSISKARQYDFLDGDDMRPIVKTVTVIETKTGSADHNVLLHTYRGVFNMLSHDLESEIFDALDSPGGMIYEPTEEAYPNPAV